MKMETMYEQIIRELYNTIDANQKSDIQSVYGVKSLEGLLELASSDN